MRDDDDDQRGNDRAHGECQDEQDRRWRPAPLPTDADRFLGFADATIIRLRGCSAGALVGQNVLVAAVDTAVKS